MGPPTQPPDGRLNVLVVEDDPLLGRLAKRVLDPLAAHVHVVQFGADAIADAADGAFHVAAVDITLPDISGLDVIAAIRERQPGMGLVAVTGRVDVATAVGAMKAGADDFLSKPFDAGMLWPVLNKALDSRRLRIAAHQALAYRELAYTDTLTGAPNRRYIDDALVAGLERATERNEPFSLAYLDIDNFKLLNGVVGVGTCDAILREVAAILATHVRPPAIFGRFGGDEFLVLFPGLNKYEARRAIEPVIRRVAELDVVNGSAVTLPVRLSCGIVTPASEDTPGTLVAAAEDAMILDKSAAQSLVRMTIGQALPTREAIQISTLKALRNLVRAIDRRDRYTRMHSDHATRMAADFARTLGLPEESLTAILVGGPIHDLGKIVVPDEILRKPGPLTNKERAAMEEHPLIGATITAAITDHETVVNIVRHHHERWDGDGYPGQLRRTEILLPTRLFTLADAFSAMTTDRPYRKGLTTEQATAEIRKNAGTQFDPDLTGAFCEMLETPAMVAA